MYPSLRLLIVALLALVSLAWPADKPTCHFNEPVSGAILSRSAFAHGYRHGYEEGYHLGNVDIGMGRHQRRATADFRGLATNYSSNFGPRKVFNAGFQSGLNAGYNDGYLGRKFRAVDALRSISSAVTPAAASVDPNQSLFDQGLLQGYQQGFARASSDNSTVARIDLHQVACTQLQTSREPDAAAQGNYCDGYRRGFALGHMDGFVLRPERSNLEASK